MGIVAPFLVVSMWSQESCRRCRAGFVEAFNVFLSRKIGARNIPLAYVARSNIEVDANPPPLAMGKPHSTLYGSVEGEMVARASHDTPLFRDDNAMVYYYLEESLRGTNYASSIKPYQRSQNGRNAFLQVISQYAGKDKWNAELTRQDDFLHSRKWKGHNHFTLEMFIAQHRNAFVSMTQCAEHVDFQLPNARTRQRDVFQASRILDRPSSPIRK